MSLYLKQLKIFLLILLVMTWMTKHKSSSAAGEWQVANNNHQASQIESTGGPGIVSAMCGDGILDAGESCDDGNTAANDGCSNTCLVENDWSCTDPLPPNPNGINYVQDGSFEAGAPDNPYWTPFTNHNEAPDGFPICGDGNDCSLTVARTGTWGVWFSFDFTSTATSSVTQSVTIPATATELTVYVRRAACGSSSATTHVSLDGNDIGTVVCTEEDSGFNQHSFSVSGYADNNPHELKIGMSIPPETTNFWIDDIALMDNVPFPGSPSVCNRLPDYDVNQCAFDFVDISASGTQILDSGIASSSALVPVNPFRFYGTTYDELVILSSGYISTDLANVDLTNDWPLPAVPDFGSGARLYVLHDLFQLVGKGYTEHFATCPRTGDVDAGEDCTIFMWDDVSHFSGGGETWDMEAVLYHDSGEVVFQIGAGNPEHGANSTTGIQNEDASIGHGYAGNTANSIPDETAVCFTTPVFPSNLDIDQGLIADRAVLTWAGGSACGYEVYESITPYFNPGLLTPIITLPYDAATHTVPLSIGDPAENHFYIVRSACGDTISDSNEVGEFDFGLE